MQHIIYQQSASSGARSIACPGWCGLTYYYRDKITEPGSKWSLDGDAAHAVLESKLLDESPPKKFIKHLKSSDDAKQHFAAIRFAVKSIQKIVKKAKKSNNKVVQFTETYLHIFPELKYGGHVDFAMVTDTTVHVIDYKHGAGVPVRVENNMQAVGYAYGKYITLPKPQQAKIDKVIITIIQPNCLAVKPIQTIQLSLAELLKQVELLKAGVSNAYGVLTHCQVNKVKPVKKHLFRGDHCQFCPAKPLCPRWYDKAKKVIKQYRKDTDGNADAYFDLSQKKLEQLLCDAVGLNNYLTKVNEYVAAQIATKKGAGLMKVVPGIRRTYVSTQALSTLNAALGKGKISKKQHQACFNKKFANLQILKANLPESLYNKITLSRSNKPSIVPIGDNRKSVTQTTKDKFNNG